MVGDFLSTLSDQEKQRIKERTDTLVKLLAEWARQHACIHPIRIPITALTTAITLPRLSVLDALTMAQMILWIFGIDDEADKRTITPAQVRQKAEQWYSMANHGSGNDTDDNDAFTVTLLEMKHNLSRSYLFESLREYWASCLRQYCRAMAQEYQYALAYRADGACVLPSLNEYLRGGIHSIGFSLWGSMALILFRDPSVVERLEPIGEVIKHASIALRLYNDVATFDKESQTQDINSILIMYHAMLNRNPNVEKGKILAKAKQYVLQLADSYAQKSYVLLEQLETDSKQFEEATSRLVIFHAHFYGYTEHDYHTTPQSEAYEWLRSTA